MNSVEVSGRSEGMSDAEQTAYTLARIRSIVDEWAASDGKPIDAIPSRTVLRSIQQILADDAALSAARSARNSERK